MSAKWIWYPGDFELYHSMLLHSRRTEYDHDYPAMWHVSRPEYMCRFLRVLDLKEPVTAFVRARGKGFVRIGEKGFLGGLNQEITFPNGHYEVEVAVLNIETFPAIFCDVPEVATGEGWMADLSDQRQKNVGCEPAFTHPDDDPAIFPFSYQALTPVSVETLDGGVLYDFGRESFGPVKLVMRKEMGEIGIFYGESREEALDTEFTMIRERICAEDGEHVFPARAFRYIYLTAEKGTAELTAELEYLPIEDKASFRCDDERIGSIWDICTRTFHLNSREFFLDGIKRDRWVWAGDAYQSYMIDRYLYMEPQIIKRTIRALLDRPPYKRHINTINDYSAYMFLGVYEYYFATGDRAFVASIWEMLKELYGFIVSRLDPKTGYVIQQPGDWIFIDWHGAFDREGPFCAEQLLLHSVYRTMEALSELMGEDGDYQARAEALHGRIMRDFWDEEQGAFIDSFVSGRRNVTRHASILAILYDFVDEKKQKLLLEHVVLNDAIPEITTPYFKLFELLAIAKLGRMELVQDYIDSYWGGMLDHGATSAWEEYIPSRQGIEHYEMYGDKYGCSLCHAWGSGPILLLGKYCAGVQPTAVGTASFEVRPHPGRYTQFDAVVPIGTGTVSVHYTKDQLRVRTDVPGGTLKFGGREAPIPVGETLVWSLDP